jgi:hypothetical protein
LVFAACEGAAGFVGASGFAVIFVGASSSGACGVGFLLTRRRDCLVLGFRFSERRVFLFKDDF